MVEKIEHEGRLYALVLRRETEVEGASFFTPPENDLQLGLHQHRRGAEIKPHLHRDSTRTVRSIQEVLHIQRGKVEADFYDEERQRVARCTLEAGDTVLLLAGGHGFRMLEDTKMVEVKQGPYYGVEADKSRFT